jgi:hypothetical protein
LTKGDFDELLIWKIEDVDDVCRLTNDQKKTLSLAGQRDIKRLLNRVDGFRSKLQSAEFDDQLGEMMLEFAEIRRAQSSRVFERNSLFAKAQERALTPEQLAKLTADPTVASSPWIEDFGAARRLAGKLGRPILICFHAMSPPCRQLEETLKTPKIAQTVHRSFVGVSIDIYQKPTSPLLHEYNITSVPCVLVLNADGAPVRRTEGFESEEKLLWALRTSQNSVQRPTEDRKVNDSTRDGNGPSEQK